MRSVAGAGYEDVREPDKDVHSWLWPRTNLAVAIFKGHLCLSSNPEATGWGREEKHNRATWSERGKGKTGEGREGCK